MPTDTKLNQLIINQLTQEQYDEAKAAGTLSDTELYITDSDDDPQVKSNLSQTIDDSTTKYPSNKAVKDESSRITTLMDTKITNCITYIPQDIKLELNNGTLTLKAGSKVYVPNGKNSDESYKFDIVTIESDLTVTFDNALQKCVLISPNNTIVHGNLSDHFISSSAAPSISWGYWYDLTNNQMKWTNDGSTWVSGYSLPICIATGTNGSVTSIDQVFNGFGYIGSTVYALPGVKGLIPNGRNADGSLKSIEFTLNKVITKSHPNQTWDSLNLLMNTDDIGFVKFPNTWNYIEQENKIVDVLNNNSQIFYAVVGNGSCHSGKIISFTPKTVFHALDYNDKSTISGWSMPSNRYVDLTLAASGSTYTAPANGYFSWYCYKNNNGYIFVQSSASLLPNRVANASNDIAGFMPVKKGDIVMVEYANLKFNRLRFIYAEGFQYNPVSSSSKNHGYIITNIPTDQNDIGGAG
nr:MAG TPA: hypothetical protein [Siphoviridae sp. ctD5s5]